RSFHGSVEGSFTAVTLILPLPRLIVSPSTFTSPGKRPWTLSKRSRCALVSTGARSLMATTSTSSRPLSAMARKMLRPMRPNPLMATRTLISQSFRLNLRKLRCCRLGHCFRCNAEMAEKVLVWGARPETGHADENTVRTDDGVPPLPHGGLNANVYFRMADHRAAHVRRR